jgi:hypothetical protein
MDGHVFDPADIAAYVSEFAVKAKAPTVSPTDEY